MPTYSASTSATVSFTVTASARVASAARSLAASTFVALAFPHVTYSAQSVAPAVFGHDANGTKNHQWDAVSVATYTFDGAVSGGRTVNAVSVAPWIAVGTASVCTASYGLQVIDAIQAVYSVWGAVCQGDDCKSDVGEEAVNCVNAAYQKLAASGKFHVFIDRVTRRQQLTGTDSIVTAHAIVIGEDIQSVESPVCVYVHEGTEPTPGSGVASLRYDLRPITDLAAFDAFSYEYRTVQPTAQQPLAYFVTISREPVQSNVEGVIIPAGRKIIRLAPAAWEKSGTGAIGDTLSVVTDNWILQYDAILKPRRFSCQTPYERLPVPQSYAETILLPLAKYYALSSRFFKGNAELKEAIMQQASEVLSQLSETDPKPKEVMK